MGAKAIADEKASAPSVVDAAVVDVGSNSIRLVVYRLEGRAIWTAHNEKVLAGLGRDLSRTGKLSPDGVDQALAALRRFKTLLGETPPKLTFTFATAAVRDAKDGPAFVKRVKKEIGFDLRVLSGVDEARYAALGVAAGDPLATGVVGDLGGASLELTALKAGKPGKGATFAVGPFALSNGGAFDPIEVQDRAAKGLKGSEKFASPTLHAVGGAWRNLALLHMRRTGYPLEIVHQYRISANEAVETARFIARQSRGSLERMGGASKKRAETMPYAATVLASLIERLGCTEVVISSYGVREGVLFEAMDQAARRADPLAAGAAALGGRRLEAEALGAAVEAWIGPAFATLPPVFGARDGAMVAAASRLAELGARLHPDHRGTLVFEQVLRAPIPGQTHTERAFLASAMFYRHTAVADPPEPLILSRLLDFQAERRARALGAAIRLACDLCGRNPSLLAKATLEIDEQRVILTTKAKHADFLLGEQAKRRAQTLATALGRALEIRTA
jgi:exopolyphosphatase/guanosine-5'-triphosphate,3'-diphosphate pyrophosphatase